MELSFTSSYIFVEWRTIKIIAIFEDTKYEVTLISGFHRALLQLITFISRLNACNYTKLRG